jgi:hypothetical protein
MTGFLGFRNALKSPLADDYNSLKNKAKNILSPLAFNWLCRIKSVTKTLSGFVRILAFGRH